MNLTGQNIKSPATVSKELSLKLKNIIHIKKFRIIRITRDPFGK